MSAPGHAGDGDRAQAYLLTTGAGGVSHHAPREALKNESYCVSAYKQAGERHGSLSGFTASNLRCTMEQA